MILNCIWWWGSSSGGQGSVEYLYIPLLPSLLIVVDPVGVKFISEIELFDQWLYLKTFNYVQTND